CGLTLPWPGSPTSARERNIALGAGGRHCPRLRRQALLRRLKKISHQHRQLPPRPPAIPKRLPRHRQGMETPPTVLHQPTNRARVPLHRSLSPQPQRRRDLKRRRKSPLAKTIQQPSRKILPQLQTVKLQKLSRRRLSRLPCHDHPPPRPRENFSEWFMKIPNRRPMSPWNWKVQAWDSINPP